MGKYVLGIDQGTTGTKAIVFDRKANIVSSAYSEFTQYFPNPGWVEHDAQEIYDVSMRVVKECLDKGGIDPKDIDAVGITNQRETTVLWDKHTGEPLCRSIVWQDTRTAEICDELIAKDGPGIMKRCGGFIVTNCAGPKIKWILENLPDVKKAVDEGRVLFGTVESWMTWKLSGGAAHVSDYSNACCTLMVNIDTMDYDEELMKYYGIPRSILPKLVNPCGIFAYTDPKEFFGAKVPISGICGDQTAAAFGQACVKPGMIKNTYGTGSFMILNCGEKHLDVGKGCFSTALCVREGAPCSGAMRAMPTYPAPPSSGCATAWASSRKPPNARSWPAPFRTTAAFTSFPPSTGSAPLYGPLCPGHHHRHHPRTTKAHICRAALECMAYQIAQSFQDMEELTGTKITALRADGGGAKSDFLLQFQADILGVPVERPVITETTCLGAAYTAGLATGFFASVDEVSANWQCEKRFEPRLTAEQRSELMDGWNRAVERAGNWVKK